MKAKIEITVIRNSDDTFSARSKANWDKGTENLKNVTIDEIAEYIKEKLITADEDGLISDK